MMKQSALILILVSLLSQALAWTIEGSVTPHQGDGSTVINLYYEVNTTYAGAARLKIYYSCNIPLKELNITVPGTYSNENFTLSPLPWPCKVCLKLYFNQSTYSDCDKDNTFMLLNSGVVGEGNTKPAITVDSEMPGVVDESEPFTSIAQVKNNKDYSVNITVYSYAYNKTKLLSEGYSGGWKKNWLANQVQTELMPGETKRIELMNKVNVTGLFDFKIRIRYADGEYYDVKRELMVLKKKESKLFLNPIIQLNNTLRFTITNTGEVAGNASLIIVADNNQTIIEEVIEPKRSHEIKMLVSDLDQKIHAYLLEEGFLIESKFFEFEKTAQEFKTEKNKTEIIENSSLISVKNKSGSVYDTITGSYALESKNGFGTETILYLIIVTISLIGFALLVRKY